MLQINEYFYRLQGKDLFVQKNHSHNEIEFIQVINGYGTVLRDENTYLLQSQHLYVIDARKAHIVYPQPDDCKTYIRNKIVIDADSFVYFCNQLKIDNILERLFTSAPISTAESPEIDRIFKKVSILCNSGKQENIGLAHGYILELMHWVSSHFNPSPQLQQDTTLQKMLNIISEKEGLTCLSEISDVLHMDKYYLCHLFKEKTGVKLSDYLSDKVYEKSCKLLMGTTYSIEDIAFMCGFASSSSLTRFFKNKSGISPAKFRKEKQTNVTLNL